MKKEYHHWISPFIGHTMEFNIYGHAGKPVIVFPSSGGAFYEFEDFKMVDACAPFINNEQITLFTVASLDKESWLNQAIHPADRAKRHNDYEKYIISELIPFAENITQRTDFLATGCSLGAYHAMNFFLKHPHIFNTVISLSGCYQLLYLIGDYMDENIYFNSPLNYLPNLHDPYYLNKYKESKIIACTGQGAWENEMIHDTKILDSLFKSKNIPAWCDFWGYDVNHDWYWWQRQLPYFLNHIL